MVDFLKHGGKYMDRKYDKMLKLKALMLLIIGALYLITIVAFIFLKEHMIVFIILLTLSSSFHVLVIINLIKSINLLRKNLLEVYESCFANNGSRNIDLDENDLVMNGDKVIKKIREMVNSATDTSIALNQYSRGILEASDSLNDLDVQISQKTNIINTNVCDIENNIENTSVLLSDVMENVFVIASATEEMSGTITTLASASGQASSGVEQVSQLVEQISESIDNIADSAKDVSSSVGSIVVSVKEINVSLNKVNQNCERSISITSDAGNKARDTNNIIKDLDNSARQIGQIVNVINKISNQTNMLALNAAIEAAGAGEAGKGFAVVATEVKALANQTAAATDEIRQQIDNMQENMSRAVSAVITINEVIEEITRISNTIGSAVTEQYVTTSEISNEVIKSAERVNNISEKIGQVAGNAQNAARNINESSKGIKDIARSASELSTASNEVAQNAEKSSTSIYNLTTTFQELSEGSRGIAENIGQFFAIISKYTRIAPQLNQYAEKVLKESHRLGVFSRR
jgi:methyl-accepting chemotaxis protein